MRSMLRISLLLALLTSAVVMESCNKVPITKRKQLSLIRESTMIEMAQTNYAQFLAEHPPLPPSDPRAERVKRVGDKIAENVEKYLKENGASKRIEGFKWQFNTVDEPVVNAWCMPGGLVVVYTDILKLAGDDDDMLAVVMGHEIAHAIARHGNERMSQSVGVKIGGAVLGASTENNNLFLQSYGVASSLGMLAYSRKHETEADKLGLVFMALAGYDPAKAVNFWEKMSDLGGEKPPAIVSTHPSDDKRIQDIKDFLPEMPKYLE